MKMDQRVEYVVGILLDMSCEELINLPSWLTYGSQMEVGDKPHVHIMASGFFGTFYGTKGSLPDLPLREVEGTPLLFGTPIVEKRGNLLMIHADIIASAYFLLTRYEEWIRCDVRDEHGRFPGKESLPFRAGFLHRPIVNEYAELLRKWANEVGIDLPAPKRHFSILLTHDVDYLGPEIGLMPAVRNIASGLLGRRPFRQGISDAIVSCGLRRNACDNLDEVIRLDQQLTGLFSLGRCRSLYFFMAGGKSLYEGGYCLRSVRIRDRLHEVLASGVGMGLHASYEAGVNPDKVGIEREALQEASGVPIEKNRHHFLAWREPEDGLEIAKAGIRWDSTLGYADVAGFRLGVCRPVSLFDPVQRCLIGIEEHPLIIMDCTLDRTNYMNLGEDAAFKYVRVLADATFRYQGEFVCLWHNTVLSSIDTSYHKRLYSRMLDYLAGLLQTT